MTDFRPSTRLLVGSRQFPRISIFELGKWNKRCLSVTEPKIILSVSFIVEGIISPPEGKVNAEISTGKKKTLLNKLL